MRSKEQTPEDETVLGQESAEPKGGISRRRFLASLGGVFSAVALGKGVKVAEALEGFLNAESGGSAEKQPRLSIEIFFSPHETFRDVERLAESVARCDVFVPEMLGWNDALLENLRKLASGKTSPGEFRESWENAYSAPLSGRLSFDDMLVLAAYNSGKHIEIFDSPMGSPLFVKVLYAFRGTRPDFSGSFEEMIVKLKEGFRSVGEIQKEREEYMLVRFEEFKTRLGRGEYPDLRGKDHVRILMGLGGMHTGLYHELTRKGEDAERTLVASPVIYSHAIEMTRRGAFGMKIDDISVARAFVEMLLEMDLRDRLLAVTGSNLLISGFFRKAASRFETKDAKEIFQKLKERDYITRDHLSLVLGKFLREKGVKIPESEEEMAEGLNFKAKREEYAD